MTHASNLHGMPLLAFWRRVNQERGNLEIPPPVLDLVRLRHAASFAALAAARAADGNPADARDHEHVLVLPDLDLHLPDRPAWQGRGSAEPLADSLALILDSPTLRPRLTDPLCLPGKSAAAAPVAAALALARADLERDLAWQASGYDPSLVMNEIAARTARRWPAYLGPAALVAVLALGALNMSQPRPVRPPRAPLTATAFDPAPLPPRGDPLVVRLEPGRAHFATLVVERGSRRLRQDLVRVDPNDPDAAYVSQREASRGLQQVVSGAAQEVDPVALDPMAPAAGVDWYVASGICRALAAAMSSSPRTVRLPRPDEWPALQRLRVIQAVDSRGTEWMADGPGSYGRTVVASGVLSLRTPSPPVLVPRVTQAGMSFRLVIARR